MQLFEGYSPEELSRVLTTSRWAFCVLIALTALAGVFTQWLSGQIVEREQSDRKRAVEQLAVAELELKSAGARMKDLGSTLGRLTQPRRLSEVQLAKLRTSLRAGPRGPVVVAFLLTEWDASEYARQIANLLLETGFDAKVSDVLLPTVEYDGLFLCAGADGKLSSHAAGIHAAFQAVGITLEAHHAPRSVKETGASEDSAILIVGNRK